MGLPLGGRWSYRNFVNDPDLSQSFDSLRFGQASIEISQDAEGTISGTIGGPGWELALIGHDPDGDPRKFKMTGTGDIGTETWVYDYLGYLVPDWPEGVQQRDAIVGSVIRSQPHSGGQATAGFVASFYAVRE